MVANPTVKRLRAVLGEFSGFVIRNGDERQKRMQRILTIVTDEAIDELAGMDELSMQKWMHFMACMVEWVATGDLSYLPDELIPFAAAVEGIDPAAYIESRNMPETDVTEPALPELEPSK